MPAYVALLRAVNVGGTGKLAMAELSAKCVAEGFTNVQTYIASGNVVFVSKQSAAKVKAALEKRLEPVSVMLRTADEMAALARLNPFPKAEPNRVMVLFLDGRPPADCLADVKGRTNEAMRLGAREIFVYYPDGQGQSKLKIPAAAAGTARNMNTVAKLAEMVAQL